MLLPDSLQPWRPWLDWFSPTLAPHIGELLRRLQPLLGSFRGRQQGGQPEPDGLDDLRRRGPYERLLGSEWLLADELPDEFLRRAAEGEHLFLTPRPRAKQSQRLIIALFDTGPLQLGSPRLVHIALWILLARRAKEAGGEFRWAILQERSAWQGASEAVHLQRLLKARCLQMADATHWQNWQEAMTEATEAHSEFWLIGNDPSRLTVTAPHLPSHVVTLRGSLTSDALEVAITEGGKHRNIELPLPPSAIAERLLKGRFIEAAGPQNHQKSKGRLALTLPPIIAPNGNHVAVPLLGCNEVQVFRIPQDKAHKTPKLLAPLQMPKHAKPLAMAFHSKTLGALIAAEEQLQFWQVGIPPVARPPREQFQATSNRANWLASVSFRVGNIARFYVLDEARRLVYWTRVATPAASNGEGQVQHVADNVLGLTAAGDAGLVYATLEKNQLILHFTSGGRRGGYRYPFQVDPSFHAETVYFAGGTRWANQCCACAVYTCTSAYGSENWSLFHSHRGNVTNPPYQIDSMTLPNGHRGFGLVSRAGDTAYALVGLSSNKRELVLYQQNGSFATVYTSPAAIVKISVDGSSGKVAMLTNDRQLIVYATEDDSIRLFIHSQKAADGEN